MNEWGIPDWRNPAAYGDCETWNTNRWRWEFLRRRDDLREEFERKADSKYAEDLALYEDPTYPWRGDPPLRPDEPGFYVSTRAIGGTFFQRLPNPRIGDQPFPAILWTDNYLANGREVIGSERAPQGWKRFDFDLDKPIEPQLETARKLLQEAQEDRHGKKIQDKHRQPEKWLNYLRVLDARAEKPPASWQQIADTVHQINSKEGARTQYKAALTMCKSF